MAAAGVTGVRGAFQYWGPYLAARGIAVFAISYRLATKTKTFPEAVQDVLAAVQFIRGKAGAFGIDPARIGLIGASAGAHLAALAALSDKKFLGAYPHDPFAATDTSVKTLVGVYGVYDMHAMWCSPRRSATRLTPTMRSAYCSRPAPKTILSTRKRRLKRSSSRSNKLAFSCDPASCPVRRITG
jgi:acetyl esterase/lipase